MVHLQELRRIFGGDIRVLDDETRLDTHVGGLRTVVSCCTTPTQGITVHLAVVTTYARELELSFAQHDRREWLLDGEHVLPRLEAGFLATGTRGGILRAMSLGEPSLDAVASTLWLLVKWAREPWRPDDGSETRRRKARARARVRRERFARASWVLFVVALVLWLRAGTGLL